MKGSLALTSNPPNNSNWSDFTLCEQRTFAVGTKSKSRKNSPGRFSSVRLSILMRMRRLPSRSTSGPDSIVSGRSAQVFTTKILGPAGARPHYGLQPKSIAIPKNRKKVTYLRVLLITFTAALSGQVFSASSCSCRASSHFSYPGVR